MPNLLTSTADVEMRVRWFQAVGAGDRVLMERLLDTGQARINWTDPNPDGAEATALGAALANLNLDLARWLVAKGADINAMSGMGYAAWAEIPFDAWVVGESDWCAEMFEGVLALGLHRVVSTKKRDGRPINFSWVMADWLELAFCRPERQLVAWIDRVVSDGVRLDCTVNGLSLYAFAIASGCSDVVALLKRHGLDTKHGTAGKNDAHTLLHAQDCADRDGDNAQPNFGSLESIVRAACLFAQDGSLPWSERASAGFFLHQEKSRFRAAVTLSRRSIEDVLPHIQSIEGVRRACLAFDMRPIDLMQRMGELSPAGQSALVDSLVAGPQPD